jgi:hypothetical protein
LNKEIGMDDSKGDAASDPRQMFLDLSASDSTHGLEYNYTYLMTAQEIARVANPSKEVQSIDKQGKARLSPEISIEVQEHSYAPV